MTETSHAEPRTLRAVLVGIAVTLAFSLAVVWIILERQAAGREYAAYDRLCAMGASGDDWVSFLEIITGKPPIVEITIPEDIAPEITFDALPNLGNLETLILAYPSLSVNQLQVIQRLRLRSLRFEGSFPRESDVSELACLHGLRFIAIPSNNLSADAQSRLRSLLPSCRIEFYESID